MNSFHLIVSCSLLFFFATFLLLGVNCYKQIKNNTNVDLFDKKMLHIYVLRKQVHSGERKKVKTPLTIWKRLESILRWGKEWKNRCEQLFGLKFVSFFMWSSSNATYLKSHEFLLSSIIPATMSFFLSHRRTIRKNGIQETQRAHQKRKWFMMFESSHLVCWYDVF